MARKQPVGYEVRRPMTLWGQPRTIGEHLSTSEIASLSRIESLVRAGRLVEIYDVTDKGTVVQTRTGITQPVTRKRRSKAKDESE